MLILLMLLISLTIWDKGQGLQVIPERTNVTYYDKKYIVSCGLNIRRYSRKSPYCLNLFGINLHQWENNITIDIVFSEYLHNEYRRSFIELHYKLCDMINNGPFIGTILQIAGVICPVSPGEHYYKNLTTSLNNFRNVFPFEKGRVDVSASLTETKLIILKFFLEAKFIN